MARSFDLFLKPVLAIAIAIGGFISAVHFHSPDEACQFHSHEHADHDHGHSHCHDHDGSQHLPASDNESDATLVHDHDCQLCKLLATYHLELTLPNSLVLDQVCQRQSETAFVLATARTTTFYQTRAPPVA